MTFNYNKNATLYSGMPQMNETLTGWEVPITLQKVVQNIVNGFAVETTTPIQFMGVWQPLRDEVLQSKPENMRSWEWIWIHAKTGISNLQTADKVIFNNKRYKIMSVKDYSLNGFIEYELVRDYENASSY